MYFEKKKKTYAFKVKNYHYCILMLFLENLVFEIQPNIFCYMD